MIRYNLQYFGGRGASSSVKGGVGGVGGSDGTLDMKPTRAWQVEDMNEAQLDKEIAKYERWANASRKEVDRISNSASIQNAEAIFRNFPGGVGGSAVNARYRKTMERYDNAMRKSIEASEKLAERKDRLEKLKAAKKAVHGTTKTQRQVKKEQKLANQKKAASGGKLGSKWVKGEDDARNYKYASGKVKTYTNGDYKIAYNWQRWELMKNGKSIGRYKTLTEAKKIAEGK